MNYLDNVGKKEFLMCDDRTGASIDGAQRVSIVAALACVHEVFAAVQKAEPKVHDFALHFALNALCQHLGWSPGDVALVEQMAAAGQATIGQQAPR